ncbi:hypothetical protein AB1Y20_006868 [Prymnesium parvum]|uniref:Protein kinase domain-containing protein n=1 Tax=Prymnesium parvum TaxID=97485 RepID=A0AB34IZL6_PRYPA
MMVGVHATWRPLLPLPVRASPFSAPRAPRGTPRLHATARPPAGGGGGGGGAYGAFDAHGGGPPSAAWLLALLLLLAAAVPWARRGVRFWCAAAPIILSYAALLARLRLEGATDDERRLRLLAHHEASAPRALRHVQLLAGGYVKMGQVLSNRADLLPSAYVRALGTLQDDVPPREWGRMERALRRESPRLLASLASVERQPLGAASTGQAHLASLRDGSRVVLKLQYADARASFGADLGNVARLARLVLPAVAPVVQEVRRRFRAEFDYLREAHDMAEIGRAVARDGGRVVVPRPVLELTTRRALVMEYLPGEKMLEVVQRQLRSSLGESGYSWVRAQAMGISPPMDATRPSRWTLCRAAPTLWRLRRQTRRRLGTLVRVLGRQVFHDGVFHADPHPGNVLLLPGGKLGLIDYGQVVRLSDAQRRSLARLIVALANRAEGKGCEGAVVSAAVEMGFKTKRMSADGLCRLVTFFFDCDERPVNGKAIGPATAMRAIHECDPIVHIPHEYILAARVSLLMRGTAQLMAQDRLHVAVAWRKEAEHALRTT